MFRYELDTGARHLGKLPDTSVSSGTISIPAPDTTVNTVRPPKIHRVPVPYTLPSTPLHDFCCPRWFTTWMDGPRFPSLMGFCMTSHFCCNCTEKGSSCSSHGIYDTCEQNQQQQQQSLRCWRVSVHGGGGRHLPEYTIFDISLIVNKYKWHLVGQQVSNCTLCSPWPWYYYNAP